MWGWEVHVSQELAEGHTVGGCCETAPRCVWGWWCPESLVGCGAEHGTFLSPLPVFGVQHWSASS